MTHFLEVSVSDSCKKIKPSKTTQNEKIMYFSINMGKILISFQHDYLVAPRNLCNSVDCKLIKAMMLDKSLSMRETDFLIFKCVKIKSINFH